jgi:hypothetical protein
VGPPASHGVPRAPCYSGTRIVTEGSHFCLPDYHRLWWDFPDPSTGAAFVTPDPRPQPRSEDRFGLYPLSLAATNGVSVDFLSCRYLDVSVPCVRFTWPIHSAMDDRRRLPAPNGFPHSVIPGLTDARLLPRTYRSLPRPSSPLDTKTSPIHS